MAANALVIAASEDVRMNLSSMVMEAGISDVSASDGRNIREIATAKSYSLVVLVLPLEEEFGLETAAYICRNTNSAALIFVPSKTYDEISAKIAHTGAAVLPKSAAQSIAVGIIRSMIAINEKFDELRSENAVLRQMVNEMKLVNRAKCVLIEYLRISEKEAHRQLQKRAMEQRITITQAAEDIIRTYEYR